jgi:hypothetical protein
MLVAPQKIEQIILIEIYNKVSKTVWQTLKPQLLGDIAESEALRYQRDDCYFLDNFGNELDRETVDSLKGSARFSRVAVMSVDWANSEDSRLSVKWERTKLKQIWLQSLSSERVTKALKVIVEVLTAEGAEFKFSHYAKNLEDNTTTKIHDDWEQD